jgi:hypothetical protein
MSFASILTYTRCLFNKILLIFMPGFSLDFGAYSLLAFAPVVLKNNGVYEFYSIMDMNQQKKLRYIPSALRDICTRDDYQ